MFLRRLVNAGVWADAEPAKVSRVFDFEGSMREPVEHYFLEARRTILRRYRKVLKAAKLDTTHNLHGLRHTFGTQCAARGVEMRLLQEWMGHCDISTTQRYADYAPSRHEADLMRSVWAPQGHNRRHDPSESDSTEQHPERL
jgi:integrase